MIQILKYFQKSHLFYQKKNTKNNSGKVFVYFMQECLYTLLLVGSVKKKEYGVKFKCYFVNIFNIGHVW